ncbi:hypothetical protein Tco_1005280 [Tanacetum coccineum]|uniref:Uncharacterized protein n=1 Tax=Tanacetum coccineum TaxID=301880 RepID=A0ABQ5FGR6_9ASTR
MSADSAVTYTSVHSEARSWSIPSEDPYEEAAQQLTGEAPTFSRVCTLIPMEAGGPCTSPPPLPPSFLAPRIRPLSPRALEVEMRDVASAYYHSLHPSGTPPLLPIPLPAPSTSRRADIPEADTPPRKRLLLTTPRPGCEIGESSAAAAARQPGPTIETRLLDTERRIMTALELVNRRVTYQVDVCTRESSEFCTRHHDAQTDRAAVRAEIEILRRERLAYEQESIQTRQDLARSEAHCRALEARVTVLETEVHRHEWQRQAADDLAVQYIMRTQALEAGARVDTLEDTGVAAAMAEAEASRVRNGYNSNGSGPRPAQTARECSYSEFLKCKPLLQRALRSRRTHSMQLIPMPGSTEEMMTDKYCPRGEIKKIETENRQDEKYIGGLPDMILGSVKASKSKTMQEVIEFTTELMEDKTHAYAERQAERKREYDSFQEHSKHQPIKSRTPPGLHCRQ